MIETEPLSSEILRALRGPRSQVAFSRRLGYRSNVAHTWETGRRWPTASRVFSAARRVGVDIEGHIRRFYKVDSGFLDEVDLTRRDGVAVLLRDLRRQLPIREISERTGRSRFAVSRWLSGAAEPRLPDLLRVIDACTQRMLDFVAVFVDPAVLPSARDEWIRLEAARTLFWRRPAAQLVLLSLELEGYRHLPRHDDRWLAARLDVPLYELVADLERLQSTGQITWTGSHYAIGEVRTVDTRRNPGAGTDLKRYWANVALERLDEDEASSSYNVFSVSSADLERIIELYRSTYRHMRAIVASSEPGDRMVLVQQQVIPLDRTRQGGNGG